MTQDVLLTISGLHDMAFADPEENEENESMEIMKSGITNAHMVFEKNQMNVTYYDTPYGQLHVGIHTRKLDVNVDDERIDIAVEYGLDVNHEATADCRIAMSIRPKAQAEEAISGK